MRTAARLPAIWAAATAGLLIADALLGAVRVDRVAPAVAAGAITGLLNIALWPLLIRLALPVTVRGGLGGAQSFAFMVVPADLPLPPGGLVGAETAHRMLRGWLARLGHEAYA